MKVVLLTLELKPYAIYLAHKMKQAGFLDLIVLEKAVVEKKKKLRRMLFKKIWRFPINALDVLVAWLYLKKCNALFKKELLQKNNFKAFPSEVEILPVGNVNSQACLDRLDKLKPEVIIVLGSSILKPETIAKAKYCLNIHGGLLPKYRNVRAEFWSAFTGDLQNYGASLVHLDAGLDTGDIAFEKRVELNGNETLSQMKLKNIIVGTELALKALSLVAQGKSLPRKTQDKSKKAFFPTPGFFDYLQLFAKKRILP